eukprot:4197203-Amphidinium_carterae.1
MAKSLDLHLLIDQQYAQMPIAPKIFIHVCVCGLIRGVDLVEANALDMSASSVQTRSKPLTQQAQHHQLGSRELPASQPKLLLASAPPWQPPKQVQV